MNIRYARDQRGIVLVVSLILLIGVTLMVVTASNIVQTNLKVIGNLESRERAREAAVAAIEEAISSLGFSTTPENMFEDACGDNQLCFDADGDADVEDIIVSLTTPTCVSAIPKKNSDLDVYNFPDQASCFLPPGVYSMCAGSVWEFEATAVDAVTGAEVTVRQGVSVLTTLNNIDTECPLDPNSP